MDGMRRCMLLLLGLTVFILATVVSASQTHHARMVRVLAKQSANAEELLRVKRHMRSEDTRGSAKMRMKNIRDEIYMKRLLTHGGRVRREMIDEPALIRVKRKEIRNEPALISVNRKQVLYEPALSRVKRKQIREELALSRVKRTQILEEPALSRVKRKQIREEPALSRVKRKQIRDEPASSRIKRKHIRDEPALSRVKRKQILDEPALSRVKRTHIRDEPALIRVKRTQAREEPALIRVKRKPVRNEPVLHPTKRRHLPIDNSDLIERALERVKRIKRHTAVAMISNKAQIHRLHQLRRRKRAYALRHVILRGPASVVKKNGNTSHRRTDPRSHQMKHRSYKKAKRTSQRNKEPSFSSNNFRRGKKSSAIQPYHHKLVSGQTINSSSHDGRIIKKANQHTNRDQHPHKNHKRTAKRPEKASHRQNHHFRNSGSANGLLRVKRI